MKLNHVEIVNFRSIKETTIYFDKSCRVLVGINESGKSNILRALRLLSPAARLSKTDDLRERVGTETIITNAYVRFVFDLEKSETDTILEAVRKSLPIKDNPFIVSTDGATLELSEFCRRFPQGIYRVDILKEERRFHYWSLGSGYSPVRGWKKPSKTCPADYLITFDDEPRLLRSFDLIRENDFPDIPKEYLEDVSMVDVQWLVGKQIVKVIQERLPEVVYWEYDEKHLLPNEVDIDTFTDEPETCPPLLNMFVLAGYREDNIKETIRSALQGTSNQIQNFLNHIADKTTTHFRSVWKEYRDVEFSLHYHGTSIVPGVKESNTHDFTRRSDGFKRFVTFLLMISVKEKSEKMENTVLLIDEPEISLHPSGARYLRDELIRISNKNYVVYTTHSIFMIDAADVGRHYIIKKKKEITTITEAQESNLADEEVLLNALGYSAFEILKQKNLIFEGYKDKRLFEVALEAAKASLRTKFAGLGVCHATGASSLKAITPIIELARRECLIISDGDNAALAEQKRYKRDGGFGTWLTYQQIDASIEAITGEDFIRISHISRAVNSVLSGGSLPAFAESALPKKRRLDTIKSWLMKNGMSDEQAKNSLVQIKERIFETMSPSDIEPDYFKLLEAINLDDKTVAAR